MNKYTQTIKVGKHNLNCRMGCKHLGERQKNGHVVNSFMVDKFLGLLRTGTVEPTVARELLRREYGI